MVGGGPDFGLLHAVECHVWVHCFFCSSDGMHDKQVVELTLRRRCSQRYPTNPSVKIFQLLNRTQVVLSREQTCELVVLGRWSATQCLWCMWLLCSALLLLTLPAGTKPRTSRQQSPGGEKRRKRTCPAANSKHWFTTSFLQPLPYLVMP